MLTRMVQNVAWEKLGFKPHSYQIVLKEETFELRGRSIHTKMFMIVIVTHSGEAELMPQAFFTPEQARAFIIDMKMLPFGVLINQ